MRGMLGALDQTYLLQILEALAESNGPRLMAIADDIAARSLSFGNALQDLGALLHRIAVLQMAAGEAEAPEGAEAARVAALAEMLSPEEVQLHYQIAAHGRRDLSLAPDEYAGFSMTLLRMLAFRPDAGESPTERAAPRAAPVPAPARPAPQRAQPVLAKAEPSARPSTDEPRAALRIDDWLGVVGQLQLTGLTRELVQQAELVTQDAQSITLRVPIKSLLTGPTLDKLKAALAQHFGRPVAVMVEVGAVGGPTVAAKKSDERAARQAEAESIIQADPFVQSLVRDFGASVVPGSVKPV